MEHIVLYSGGPDSWITYSYVCQMYPGDKITMLYFALGHRYCVQELFAIDRTFPFTVIDITLSGLRSVEAEDAFIPGRNALLVTRAANYVKEKEAIIWLSVQKGELNIPDRTPEFMVQIGRVVSLLEKKHIRVESPWKDVDKSGMVMWYVGNGGPVSELRMTWSCYSPAHVGGRIIHCGDCPACLRRYIAFYQAGVVDEFKVHPKESGTAHLYRMRAREGYYDEFRCKQVLKVLGDDQ